MRLPNTASAESTSSAPTVLRSPQIESRRPRVASDAAARQHRQRDVHSELVLLGAEAPPRPLTPGEQAQVDALNHLAALRENLDHLRRAELGSYADALTAAITARLAQLNLNVPIHVNVSLAPNDADLRYGTTPLPGDSYSRIDETIASAITETPGPAMLSGTPLERAERLAPGAS
jgi:hypothetical protein